MRLSFVFFFPCRFFFLFLSLFIVFTRCLDGWRWRADWPGKTGATGFFFSNFVLFLFVCLFRFFLLWLTFVKRFLFLFLFARSSPVVGRSRARRVSQRIGRFHRRDRFPNFFGGGRYPKRLKGGGRGYYPEVSFLFLFFFLQELHFGSPTFFWGGGSLPQKAEGGYYPQRRFFLSFPSTETSCFFVPFPIRWWCLHTSGLPSFIEYYRCLPSFVIQ